MIQLNEPIAYIDVDQTLVLWDGTEWQPNPIVIEQLIRHKKRGHSVVVWSAGGAEWACEVVKELELEEWVDAVASKPTWIWDDLPPSRLVAEENWCWRGGQNGN